MNAAGIKLELILVVVVVLYGRLIRLNKLHGLSGRHAGVVIAHETEVAEDCDEEFHGKVFRLGFGFGFELTTSDAVRAISFLRRGRSDTDVDGSSSWQNLEWVG